MQKEKIKTENFLLSHLRECLVRMNIDALRNGGEILEIFTDAFLGGIICLPYQLSFGLSLRVYDGLPMFRIYIGPLKIWVSERRPEEAVRPGEINKRVDW